MPVIIIIILLGVVGYLIFKNTQIQKNNGNSTLTSIVPTQIINKASPTLNPTANWKTYYNSIDKFSFKYPSTWTIDTKGDKGDEKGENIQVKLTKDQAVIQIYANMVGIGGLGRDYQGTKFQIDGNNLYMYKVVNTFNNTIQIGITDSLTQSLGVFRVSDKTYSITLSYPNSFTQTQITDFEAIFDQILSTFKFSEVNQTIDLNTIKSACIELEGSSKYWDDIYKECNAGSATKTQFQTFCSTYNGKFEDNVSTCRHATVPCGPEATYICSFNVK